MNENSFEAIFIAALSGKPIRLKFPSPDAALRWRQTAYNWLRKDRRAYGERFAPLILKLPSRFPGLMIVCRTDNLHLIEELSPPGEGAELIGLTWDEVKAAATDRSALPPNHEPGSEFLSALDNLHLGDSDV